MSFSFRYKKKDKYYLIWLSLIMLIIFYSFFFQYGVYPINHAMMALSALIILFTFIYIIFIKKYRIIRGYFNTILLFVFTSVIVGVFISGGQYGIDIGIRMIEYALTSYALFTLLVVKPYLLTKILWSAFVSITLLAITVLIKGTEVTSTGAIGLENLNVNEMSSYFIFMVFCSLILFANSKKKAEKGILIFADIVVILAQIGTASRRGFLVMLAVFLGSMIFAVIPYFSKENSRKKLCYTI